MSIAARLDHPHPFDWPIRPVGVALTVLGFMVWWPVGVATLAVFMGSRRMGCWHHGGEQGFGPDQWRDRWRERMEARREHWERKWARHCGPESPGRSRSSGNRAFDAYRDETLKRLEDEEKEFREFLERLRFAKDKAQFDDFLANRRPPAAPEAPVEH
jgi:hypothetical protein